MMKKFLLMMLPAFSWAMEKENPWGTYADNREKDMNCQILFSTGEEVCDGSYALDKLHNSRKEYSDICAHLKSGGRYPLNSTTYDIANRGIYLPYGHITQNLLKDSIKESEFIYLERPPTLDEKNECFITQVLNNLKIQMIQWKEPVVRIAIEWMPYFYTESFLNYEVGGIYTTAQDGQKTYNHTPFTFVENINVLMFGMNHYAGGFPEKNKSFDMQQCKNHGIDPKRIPEIAKELENKKIDKEYALQFKNVLQNELNGIEKIDQDSMISALMDLYKLPERAAKYIGNLGFQNVEYQKTESPINGRKNIHLLTFEWHNTKTKKEENK